METQLAIFSICEKRFFFMETFKITNCNFGERERFEIV